VLGFLRFIFWAIAVFVAAAELIVPLLYLPMGHGLLSIASYNGHEKEMIILAATLLALGMLDCAESMIASAERKGTYNRTLLYTAIALAVAIIPQMIVIAIMPREVFAVAPSTIIAFAYALVCRIILIWSQPGLRT
jgi:hypothetical protein